MKTCENCISAHDGSYGSGRFCSSKCARGFSTKKKRADINKKVSASLKGRAPAHDKGFKKGYDERRYDLSDEDRKRASESLAKIREESYKSMDFIDLPQEEKRRIVLSEQDSKCGECGINEWRGNPLTLELHHIDGDHDNNTRKNLVFLCPNCHSQTDSWRTKKSAR